MHEAHLKYVRHLVYKQTCSEREITNLLDASPCSFLQVRVDRREIMMNQWIHLQHLIMAKNGRQGKSGTLSNPSLVQSIEAMLFIITSHSFQTYVLCGRSETAQHYLARPVLPTHSRIPHTVWLRNSGSGQRDSGKSSQSVADSGLIAVPVSWADFWDQDMETLIHGCILDS